LNENSSLQDILTDAHSSNFQLIYLLAPPRLINSDISVKSTHQPYPGTLADTKTTYIAALHSFDMAKLCTKAFTNREFKIKPYDAFNQHNIATEPSEQLKKLATIAGSYSRFEKDTLISRTQYEHLFHTWIRNSINHTIADEVFVAYDRITELEMGFITVLCRDDTVNIGLLAVDSSVRRRGVASALLSRAVLWTLEQLGDSSTASINVITQADNTPACKCYEDFGFQFYTQQDVYHVWLPRDLKQN
jgi:ribosomal protein S18 acetylase RimI-like enzyme